ncbi:MAG: glycosyltransferase family 2 protein [Planctomycetota bacterium]|nr:MAG: glycosyltransferase family 2 protein [Planctomycetota bacterium]
MPVNATSPGPFPGSTPSSDALRKLESLSVLVPVYDEEGTIYELLRRVHAVSLPLRKQIVVVDDGSSDGTVSEVERFAADHPDARIDLVRHERNRGKGAAVRTALARAGGDVVIVQDGDLEYDPRDFPQLLEPILDGRADAVFGSRFLGGPHRVLYFWHSVANRALTLLSNMLTNFNLTDMEVCYKAMRRDVALSLDLRSDRFGIEPEITAKLARGGWRLYEVPVSYAGRSYEEGKKITWRDGAAALFHIVRYRFL